MNKIFNNHKKRYNLFKFSSTRIGSSKFIHLISKSSFGIRVDLVPDYFRGSDKKVFVAKCYEDIKTLIENNSHDSALQNIIETYLFNATRLYNKNRLYPSKSEPDLNYSKHTSEWIIKKKLIIFDYLTKMMDNKPILLAKKEYTFNDLNNIYTIDLLNQLSLYLTSEILIDYFLKLASTEHNEGGLYETDCFTALGNKLVDLYVYSMYINYKDIFYLEEDTLSQWKKRNKKAISHFSDDPLIQIGIAGNLLQILSTDSANLIEFDYEWGYDNKLHNIIRITKEARENIASSDYLTNVVPSKLPMIVEPKAYALNDQGEITLGGYLNNDKHTVDELYIKRVGYRDATTLRADNFVIGLINGISKIPYKINQDTLKYIEDYGVEKGILIDPNREDVNDYRENPRKRTKRSIKELKYLISRIHLQTNIIKIAETYISAKKIYFPVRIDQTRLYCTPEYFNYQSTELAKSLLNFANPDCIHKQDIDAINYFKSYGAMLFFGSLSNISLKLRVKWIDRNNDYILNFRDNDIINKAKSKACFVSFCFEYERLIKFLNEVESVSFYTHLPILLDASSNGYLHSLYTDTISAPFRFRAIRPFF